MLTANGKTGTAPGTTTLALDGLGHDSGTLVYNAWGIQTPPLASPDLGVVLPTDFDRAKILGYLPYLHGWVVGNVVKSHGFSDADLPADPMALQRILTAEQIKAHRSTRTWAAIAGVVGIAGLIVAIVAMKKR